MQFYMNGCLNDSTRSIRGGACSELFPLAQVIALDMTQ